LVGTGSGALSQRVGPFYRVSHCPANCGRLQLADKAVSRSRQEHHAELDRWLSANETFRTGGNDKAGKCCPQYRHVPEHGNDRSLTSLPEVGGLWRLPTGAYPYSAMPFVRAE